MCYIEQCTSTMSAKSALFFSKQLFNEHFYGNRIAGVVFLFFIISH